MSKGALGVDFGTTNSSIALGSQTVRDHKGGAALQKIEAAIGIATFLHR
jgi:molecular chaperone DnaK (HSP70)